MCNDEETNKGKEGKEAQARAAFFVSFVLDGRDVCEVLVPAGWIWERTDDGEKVAVNGHLSANNRLTNKTVHATPPVSRQLYISLVVWHNWYHSSAAVYY